jgi:putative ABC transport system permease protein
MIGYFFKSAFTTLKYNKFRTFLTGLGIFVGVASVIIIVSFSDSFSHHLSNEFNQKVTLGLVSSIGDNTDFTEVITSNEIQSVANEVRKMEDVLSFEQAEGSKKIDCQLSNGTWKYSVDIAFDDYVPIVDGNGFDSAIGNVVIAYQSETDETSPVYKLGDSVVIDGIVYTIIGTTTDLSATIYFPQRLSTQVSYQEAFDIAAFYLTTNNKNPDTVNIILDMLNAELEDSVNFVNYTEGDSESISSIFSTISIFLSLIASISLIVSAINIINIMYISVLERANEIAIYRSLGMTKGMVVYLFLIESLLIVVMFALMGYLFGLLTSYLILAIMDINLYVSINSLLLIVAISIVLGIGAGIKPAMKASNTNLSILLR